MNNSVKFVLYAPNVNSGGGSALLKSLLTQWHEKDSIYAILDHRIIDQIPALNLKNVNIVYFAKNDILSLTKAEIILWRISSDSTKILCFHNLPPIFCRKGKVFIFLQNRLIVKNNIRKLTSFHRYLLVLIEKIISKTFASKSFHYITQTESMKQDTRSWLLPSAGVEMTSPVIHVLPFMPNKEDCDSNPSRKRGIKWQFLYVASGESHKNHKNLIKAWEYLNEDGINLTLALTITKASIHNYREINWQSVDKLNIHFLGHLEPREVEKAYLSTTALIFPSKIESFGMPLIEASRLNIPILAGELDFVRDVCRPVQTFNPDSPISIARAVKRYLNIYDNTPTKPLTSSEFWDAFCDLR